MIKTTKSMGQRAQGISLPSELKNRSVSTTQLTDMKGKNKPKGQPGNKANQWAVAIACLSVFPLIYLIGRSISEWLN